MPLGRLHKRILCKWLLYDGEETQKSWKPMLNTIFALRGSSECSVQSNAHKFFVQSAKRHCREDLLTPESYYIKIRQNFVLTYSPSIPSSSQSPFGRKLPFFSPLFRLWPSFFPQGYISNQIFLSLLRQKYHAYRNTNQKPLFLSRLYG